jgi:hypothetical protein
MARGANIINSVERVFTSLVDKLQKGIDLELKEITTKNAKVDKLTDEITGHQGNIDKATRMKSKISSLVKDEE